MKYEYGHSYMDDLVMTQAEAYAKAFEMHVRKEIRRLKTHALDVEIMVTPMKYERSNNIIDISREVRVIKVMPANWVCPLP